MLVLSTSPCPGGSSNVLKMAKYAAPFFRRKVVVSLSISGFNESFDMEKGALVKEGLAINLKEAIVQFKASLSLK